MSYINKVIANLADCTISYEVGCDRSTGEKVENEFTVHRIEQTDHNGLAAVSVYGAENNLLAYLFPNIPVIFEFNSN